MAKIAKSARVSNFGYRYAGILSIEHEPSALQAHLSNKCHRGVPAILFERMKQAARTCARDCGEHFDGERLVPTRLDVFLGSLDLPRSRPSRTAIEKMAIIVAVADEEPRHQGLLDLDQRNKGDVLRRSELSFSTRNSIRRRHLKAEG